MKAKFYLFLIGFCCTLGLSAQQYSTMIVETWDNGNWKKATRSTQIFDSGNLIKNTNDAWNSATSDWDRVSVTNYTLNPNSTVNYAITQVWDKNESKWFDAQKRIYTYDASNNVLTVKVQTWMNDSWMDYSLTTNTYNQSGQLTKSLDKTLNMMTMQLEDSYQTTYTYNQDGTRFQRVFQIWNKTPGQWENTQRMTSSYNASKTIISEMTENYLNDTWVNHTKWTITYNQDNTTVNYILYQDWNGTGSNWVDSGKDIYSYFGNGSISQIIIQDWESSQWQNKTRMSYTYPITSIPEPVGTGSGFRVFPNPFRDVVFIEVSYPGKTFVQIFTAEGQLIRAIDRDRTSSAVNLGYLKDGIYLLRMVSPEKEQVVRLLKIK